jgi:WS/DGAT/MGAT family acyltransferase
LINVVPTTLSSVVDTVKRARSGRAMARPFAAPQTPFNANVTGHRNIAYAQLDLEDIKTVKNHFGVKLNDVVMALVSGVLRKFLADRGELPDSPLVAMVPVSVHDKSDRPGRNQVSGMFSNLETHIDTPAERLKSIAEANSVAKQHSSAIGATLLQDWTQFAAPAVFGVAMRLYASTKLSGARPVHNLVISNVPGPRVELFCAGARLEQLVPVSAVVDGVRHALADPADRGGFSPLIESLNKHKATIVEASAELFRRGVELYTTRPDKSWSLTDCISFVVMQDELITYALTGDKDFEQAGFTALLK